MSATERVAKRLKPITPEHWAGLRAAYPDTLRIFVAMQLARDVEACAALLSGKPVDPLRLDPRELERASARRLVRLDMTMLDLLKTPVEEAA
jgi:hypothetical protein